MYMYSHCVHDSSVLSANISVIERWRWKQKINVYMYMYAVDKHVSNGCLLSV